MDDPRRCKIIKCGVLVEGVATLVQRLAVADPNLISNAQADSIIEQLETAAEKIEAEIPNPPIT